MPPEESQVFSSDGGIFLNSLPSIGNLPDERVADNGRLSDAEADVLVDNKGRPYKLGPKGFVCDLNTRAVKIARRVQARALAASEREPNGHVSVAGEKEVRIATCRIIFPTCVALQIIVQYLLFILIVSSLQKKQPE